MQELIYLAPGEVAWRERPDLELHAEHEAIVRPIASTTCDVDQYVLRGQSPFPAPFAIGHECVGEVVEIGDAVSDRMIGEIVSVPYHRLCGECEMCRAGLSLHCERMPTMPVYGFPGNDEWGGMFSEEIRVPYADRALVPVPSEVDPIAAVSAGDNLSNAWEVVVPHLRRRPDARVLIVGAGGFGLYAAQWATACEARSIVYVDDCDERLELAEQLGATARQWSSEMRSRDRFDVIVHAAAAPESLRFCLESAAPEAICENVAIYFEPVPLPLASMHLSGVHLHSTFCHARPLIPEVLAELAEGTINPRLVESEIRSYDEAPSVLADPTHKPVLVREAKHGGR